MNRSLTEILLAPLDWVTRPFVERAMRRMHTYLEIANDAFITTEWVEFEPVESMRFERRYQEVYVSLRDCRMHTEKEGLILPMVTSSIRKSRSLTNSERSIHFTEVVMV